MPAPRFRAGHDDETELENRLMDYLSLVRSGRGVAGLERATARVVVCAAGVLAEESGRASVTKLFRQIFRQIERAQVYEPGLPE